MASGIAGRALNADSFDYTCLHTLKLQDFFRPEIMHDGFCYLDSTFESSSLCVRRVCVCAFASDACACRVHVCVMGGEGKEAGGQC